jgi:hypothetical protein
VFLRYVFFCYNGLYSYESKLGRDYEQRPFNLCIRVRHLGLFLFEVRQFTVHYNVNIPPIFVHKRNHTGRIMWNVLGQ